MMSVLGSLLAFLVLSCCTAAEQGKVTMWSNNGALIGAMCEYANPPVNSITDPVLASYLRSGFHCAIGSSNPNFGIGEQCGKCYRVTSLNDDGRFGTPGSAGSAVVMVSDKIAEGGTSHFDCSLAGFTAITGAETGVFDMEFEETTCDDITGTPTVINWAGQDQWYCKMMFENIGGWGSLSSVKACLETSGAEVFMEVCNDMELFQGQTWTGCPQGTGTGMRFELTQLSPTNEAANVECSCAGAWPWPTGQRCSCLANFVAASTTAPGTTALQATTTATRVTTTTPAAPLTATTTALFTTAPPATTTTTTTIATTPAPTTAMATTRFLSTTLAPTTTPVPSCVYTAHANTAVKYQGTGGTKLKRASFSSDEAYLDACEAECNGDSSCGGFVDDPTDRRGRMCKPKKATTGYPKREKTFYAKGSGC